MGKTTGGKTFKLDRKRAKLTPEAFQFVINELAWEHSYSEIVEALKVSFGVSYSVQAVSQLRTRYLEHIEARQAELSRELWQRPLMHAFWQVAQVERIMQEASKPRTAITRQGKQIELPPDWAIQLKCLEVLNAIADRLSTIAPDERKATQEATDFLQGLGFGQADLERLQHNGRNGASH